MKKKIWQLLFPFNLNQTLSYVIAPVEHQVGKKFLCQTKCSAAHRKVERPIRASRWQIEVIVHRLHDAHIIYVDVRNRSRFQTECEAKCNPSLARQPNFQPPASSPLHMQLVPVNVACFDAFMLLMLAFPLWMPPK